MYVIVKINVYVCTCLYTNIIYVSKCDFHCVLLCIDIYITQATPKFTKQTWREQVHRDVNIHPPTQTPKFTKHTWREQVHRDVNPTQTPKFTKHTWREQVHRADNIPPTSPKPLSSRSIHGVSKFTGTLTSPPTPPKPRSSRSIHDVSKFTGTLTSPSPPQP